MNIYNYKKRKTLEVKVGNVVIGGGNPIVIQSMANVKTSDTEAAIQQAVRIYNSGGKIVRFTTPSIADAKNLINIKSGIINEGYDIPLVADVHFSPDIADIASAIVDKVRVNPGNYVRSIRKNKDVSYTEEVYKTEYEMLKSRFIEFLKLCAKYNTAIRIGVNHGSLSERIMDRYGDTPEGIVESCMEMIRICKEQGFHNVVISVKSSNTSVMVRTVRLLADTMMDEGIEFPIHLGVTEAGEGEDGRIKSAVGIGALLSEGIGDTIRVSLSEEPEEEPFVARQIVNYVNSKLNHKFIEGPSRSGYNRYSNKRRESKEVMNIGGGKQPVVISDITKTNDVPFSDNLMTPYFLYIGMRDISEHYNDYRIIVDADNIYEGSNVYKMYTTSQLEKLRIDKSAIKFLRVGLKDINSDARINSVEECAKVVEISEILRRDPGIVLIGDCKNDNISAYHRALALALEYEELTNPLIINVDYKNNKNCPLQIKLAVDCGANLIDKLIDGVFVTTEEQDLDVKEINKIAFSVLQAAGSRISKTEYISCPGCGRTMFDLQTTINKVKKATSHLVGMKIGIMGCIVNGPGEMADADYGYVGAGKNKISLYKGTQCIEKNIPEELAVEKLIEIMKANGDWK